MVAKAAVKINLFTKFFDWTTTPKELIIPCHRHADAYEILHMFRLRKDMEYKVIAEGFLDENDNFMTRAEAFEEALRCEQLNETFYNNEAVAAVRSRILYSEDLW